MWPFYQLHKIRVKELDFRVFLATVEPHIQPTPESASQSKSLEGKCSIWGLVKYKSQSVLNLLAEIVDLMKPQKFS